MQQFLDEADLLGDHVAILAAPGKLVAYGSPVALKSSGDGYTVHVALDDSHAGQGQQLLARVRFIAREAEPALPSATANIAFNLKTREASTVSDVLQFLETEGRREPSSPLRLFASGLKRTAYKV